MLISSANSARAGPTIISPAHGTETGRGAFSGELAATLGNGSRGQYSGRRQHQGQLGLATHPWLHASSARPTHHASWHCPRLQGTEAVCLRSQPWQRAARPQARSSRQGQASDVRALTCVGADIQPQQADDGLNDQVAAVGQGGGTHVGIDLHRREGGARKFDSSQVASLWAQRPQLAGWWQLEAQLSRVTESRASTKVAMPASGYCCSELMQFPCLCLQTSGSGVMPSSASRRSSSASTAACRGKAKRGLGRRQGRSVRASSSDQMSTSSKRG